MVSRSVCQLQAIKMTESSPLNECARTLHWVLDFFEQHTPFENLLKATDPSAGEMITGSWDLAPIIQAFLGILS